MELSSHTLVGSLDGTESDQVALAALGKRSHLYDQLERVLLRTALDGTSFYSTFGQSRQDMLATSERAYRRLCRDDVECRQKSLLRGFLGIFCLTLGLLEESELVNISSSTSVSPDLLPRLKIMEDIRGVIFEDPSVRDVFVRLYGPQENGGHSDPQKQTAHYVLDAWTHLNMDSLRFYKRGTSSFILYAETMDLKDPVALKCLIYPYTRVTPIANESSEYFDKYSDPRPRMIARVRASSSKWILMDFISGPTLSEFIALEITPRRKRDSKIEKIDLTLIRTVSKAILDALSELDGRNLAHYDLAPSNIILTIDDKVDNPVLSIKSITLIDLGRNHLYSRSIGLTEGAESVYIAPEVKRETSDWISADLYSLGLIIALLAEGKRPTNATVPDLIYQEAPPLGRFVEDLIDEDPDKRLLLMQEDDASAFLSRSPLRYRHIAESLSEGIAVLQTAKSMAPSNERFFRSIYNLYRSREPRRLFHIWAKERHKANAFAKHSGWTLTWSVICALNWYMITTVVFIWALRDWGVNSFPTSVDVIAYISHQQGFPFIDSLRLRSYRLGLSAVNIQALILALSFGLVATKYYQSIYAALTTRGLNGRINAFGEFFMRFNSCWVGGPILVAILIDPRLWPWCAATGYLGVAANDFLCHKIATRAIRQGEDSFSSIPPHVKQTLLSYGEWWRLMALYSLVLYVLAYALTSGLVNDWWVYAGLIFMINVGKLYTSNSSRLAPVIRGALSRSLVVNERLQAYDLRNNGQG